MATSLDKAFEEDVRPFIDIIDELRSIGLDKDVPLPAVVVVGDQSAGKSSVLEAISGVELPRGTDIVTRCPLELRLKKIPKNRQVDELIEDGESTDIPVQWKGVISYTVKNGEETEIVTENIENPSLVGIAVEKATERLTENSKGISDGLIHLEVQSKTVPDLTLIDLPGIARVAVEGQSGDVPQMTKELIKKYVRKEETIILAVIPCNVDIATTEALQLAQQVDPEGKRTLGVLTKPDLMDHGTEGNISKIVNGEKVKLQLGYTVVKCRGQRAIENKISLEDATKSEETFFKNHELLNTLYHEKKTGVQNLSHQLTKQLVEQIKNKLPSLKVDIEDKLSRVMKELEKYGEGLPEEEHERQNFLIKLLMNLGELFKKLARAEHIDEEFINKLRLFYHVKDAFTKLAETIRQLKPERRDSKLQQEISKEIKKRKGKELPSFLSYAVFEGIVRKQIQKIRGPANDCLQVVNSIIEKVTVAVIAENLSEFEPLKMEVNNLMNRERKKAEKNATDALGLVFAMENLVFTQDGNFARLLQDIQKEDEAKETENVSSSEESISVPPKKTGIIGTLREYAKWFQKGEQMDAEHMTKCLDAYCQVATARMVECTIPMAIYYHLVKQLLEDMATEMIKIAAKPDSIHTLLKEDATTVFQRKLLVEKQERLEKATIKLMKFGSSSQATSSPDSEDENDEEFHMTMNT